MQNYCDEEIKAVYLGQPESHQEGQDYFLDCYRDMALHITAGYRLILETSHYFISIQNDGVSIDNKVGSIKSIERPGEWIDSFYHIEEDEPDEAPWVDYEHTLFVGEKLLTVESKEKGYRLRFTDFHLEVIPYSVGELFFSFSPAPYSRVLGAERLIKKCSCGGTGHLIIDFVSDYGIRCDKCHKGTYANQCVCDAIDEWNNSEELLAIGEYPKEEFERLCHGQISYIAIARWYEQLDDNMVDCESLIVEIDGKKFEVTSGYAGNGNYDFVYETFSDFNPEMWPRRIWSTEEEPLKFIKKESEPGMFPVLRFTIGNRPLLITADDTGITIGISHWDQNGEWQEFDNNNLFSIQE